jgi:hypothetical protein
MLCSVATLIHDTYLPVYLSDVLHLSNTKVRATAAQPGRVHWQHAGTSRRSLSPLPPP